MPRLAYALLLRAQHGNSDRTRKAANEINCELSRPPAQPNVDGINYVCESVFPPTKGTITSGSYFERHENLTTRVTD